MIIKRIIPLLVVLILFGLVSAPTYAASFSDSFNKNNTNRWDFSYSPYGPGISGNWRVENGILVEDQGGDDFIALVKNLQNSNQLIETQLSFNGPSGYGGVTVWFKDPSNWVSIRLYPAAGEVWVEEFINNSMNLYRYSYASREHNLYTLKVITNSTDGVLDIYIDNDYVTTHNVVTVNRIGQSGIMAGNAGGYFDNINIEKLKPDKSHKYLPQ